MKNILSQLKTILSCLVLTIGATAMSAAQKDTTFVAKGNPIVNYKYLGDPAGSGSQRYSLYLRRT